MILNRRQFLANSSLYVSSFAGFVLPSLAVAQQRTVEAETQFGRVKGVQSGAVNVFKGIPYGADTGGSNRFQPPKNPNPWSGVREALL